MPKISVIIPVYNGAKTIKKTIQSVLDQTFQDLELIIIDDGSTDQTLPVIEEISDSKIKIYSYPNAGVSNARNQGINHAQGEYISFIDADDLWTPDKLELQYQALVNHPSAKVAYSWMDWIDEDDRFLRPAARMSLEGNIYANLLIIDFIGCGSNPLILKDSLLEVGGFDPHLRGGEDWDLWIRLAARYGFVCVRSPQILYRQVATSVSKDISLMEKDCLRVIAKSFQTAPINLQHLKSYALGNLYKGMLYRSLLDNLPDNLPDGLSETPDRSKIFIVLKYFYQSIRNDPSFLKAKVVGKIVLRLLLIFLFPRQVQRAILNKFRCLRNVDAIHGYMQISPYV
jgi:glycosyltransferase involved in cell wall biosynthesis